MPPAAAAEGTGKHRCPPAKKSGTEICKQDGTEVKARRIFKKIIDKQNVNQNKLFLNIFFEMFSNRIPEGGRVAPSHRSCRTSASSGCDCRQP